MTSNLKERIRLKLPGLARRRLAVPVKASAAVLMPILERDGRLHFLLTQRTQTVATHKGQVSFPGGLQEVEDDSLEATALRETEEELGLPPSRVDIVGRFHDYLAVTEWLVAPYVGFVNGQPRIHPSPQEVERVLRVPLDFFAETLPREEKHQRLGRTVPVYFYQYQDASIWGLTAAIIKDFMDLLRGE